MIMHALYQKGTSALSRLMGLANKKIQPTIVLAANFGVATEAE
jgi:hypothetical protein